MPSTAPTLTPEQLEAFGQELDAIRARVVADLGERDTEYINKVIRAQRGLEVAGRGLLFLGFLPPAWLSGTAALSLSKILDNMEIGHNVMHGQYDWTGDERLNGKSFEWDTACPAEQWRHSHNFMHHTHTNIVGKDRDIGYGILRMSEQEPWRPYYLGNPLYAALLASFFQYGVALHDLETERIATGEVTLAEKRGMLSDIWRKVKGQTLKDYVLFPILSGPSLPFVLAGNATANLTRNLWAFTIIFCGHFPEGTHEFTELQAENETRGEWYLRQMLGSANLTGGNLFHILAGNLSFQIEHHLFPDIPAHRYGEIAEEVQEICERYELPYNTGPLHSQFGSVVRKIFRLALPGGAGPTAAALQAASNPRAVAASNGRTSTAQGRAAALESGTGRAKSTKARPTATTTKGRPTKPRAATTTKGRPTKGRAGSKPARAAAATRTRS
jgi:fatty acid desaturase